MNTVWPQIAKMQAGQYRQLLSWSRSNWVHLRRGIQGSGADSWR